jgi:glycosyltransferase involved in cell wall biosynthesis
MKIGIELRPVVPGKSGGIAPLLGGVLGTLFTRHPEHRFLVFCTVFNRHMLTAVPAHVEVWSLPCRDFNAELDRLLLRENVEVLFRSYPHEALDFPSSRQVVFIPDTQHEFHPEFFTPEVLRDRRRYFNRDLSRAGAIGTLTEHARRAILDHKWTRCRDIFLMSPALPATGQPAAEGGSTLAVRKGLPPGEYFLYPANIWPHKNHRRVLQAFELLLRRRERPLSFVFTGHPEGWEELQSEFPHLPILHLGFVTPGVLKALYEGARSLVFFSLYEGFGMPLLEAFGARTPVICSNITSLPEVGGDAVLTCDPTDIRAMCDLMDRVAGDEKTRNTLTANGEKRLPNYTWERSADSLLAACLRVAAAPVPADGETPISVSSMPLVSIVTPSYNQGRFIKETIDSVLGQSYPHVEYVVIDGNSTDETVSVLKSYGPRLNWISEPDRGQTDAINKGFARSKGEVRAYVNSDDLLLPGAVEKVVEHFRRQPDADMVYGQGVLIDEAGRRVGMYRTDDYSFARLMLDCCVCQPAAFWLTRIAEKVGPFDERLDYAMDYDYWMRIDRAGGRIIHLREPLGASRCYAETKTARAREMVYDEIFRVSKRHGGYVSIGWCLNQWHYLLCERDRWRLGHLLHRAGLCILAGRLHHFRSTRDPHDMMQYLRRVEQRLTAGKVSLLEPLWAASKRARFYVRQMGDRKRSVCGLWSDNWMEPECTVRLAPDKMGGTQRLAGVSPVENSLSISAGDELLGVYPCPANRRVEISFIVPEAQSSRLILMFSNHVRDLDRRRLSFLLDSTDLFDEQHSSPFIKALPQSIGESL